MTIARSRKHIEAHYDTSAIGTFPTRRPPISFSPPLTKRADVPPFDGIYEQLSQLELACYTPGEYILPSRLSKYEQSYGDDLQGISRNVSLSGQQKGIKALMTVNLLKRLESSVHAFRITLGKLAAINKATLSKIADFHAGKISSVSLTNYSEEDFDPEDDDLPDSDEASLGGKADIALADMDLTSWQRDLEADLAAIRALIVEMAKVTRGHDAKLQHLLTHIQQKVENPINPGNRKILLFTAFADTADYLINYDIHWNPVRIIQRFGRVDRIGSPNDSIQLVNYWPDISLDEYINLKERVENRMVIVDVTGIASDNPLDPKANEISYRKEQLQKLQDEIIEMEDL